jgi:hypothetical protein
MQDEVASTAPLNMQETEFSQLGLVSRQSEVGFVPAAMSPGHRHLFHRILV